MTAAWSNEAAKTSAAPADAAAGASLAWPEESLTLALPNTEQSPEASDASYDSASSSDDDGDEDSPQTTVSGKRPSAAPPSETPVRVELFHQPDGDGKPELLAHGKAVLKGTSGRVSRLPLHGELPGRREKAAAAGPRGAPALTLSSIAEDAPKASFAFELYSLSRRAAEAEWSDDDSADETLLDAAGAPTTTLAGAAAAEAAAARAVGGSGWSFAFEHPAARRVVPNDDDIDASSVASAPDAAPEAVDEDGNPSPLSAYPPSPVRPGRLLEQRLGIGAVPRQIAVGKGERPILESVLGTRASSRRDMVVDEPSAQWEAKYGPLKYAADLKLSPVKKPLKGLKASAGALPTRAEAPDVKQSAPVAPPKPPAKPPAKKAKKAPAKSAVVDTGAPLCKPPLPPEAVGARARESLTRPMSAPSARLLLQLDECARIKAAFERRGMRCPTVALEGALMTPDDRPKEQCEAALPGKGSKLVAAKLMAGLDPLAEAAAKKKGTKKKGGKKGGKKKAGSPKKRAKSPKK